MQLISQFKEIIYISVFGFSSLVLIYNEFPNFEAQRNECNMVYQIYKPVIWRNGIPVSAPLFKTAMVNACGLMNF